MNELALFAGAGGGILGGHLLGWRTVCAVEWTPYAAGVLVARQNDGILPPFPIWDDVQTFDGRPWRGLVDVVSGGFPCQDISAAGGGKGIEGERSGMWRHMARIVGEVRPRHVFVENSPLLVGRGLAALGYDAHWACLSASDCGAPHQRDRIWLVADSNSEQLRAAGFGQASSKERATEIREEERKRIWYDPWECSEVVAYTSRHYGERIITGNPNTEERTGSQQGPTGSRSHGIGRWPTEPNVGRVANGVAARVDRLKALGNGQVPRVAATAFLKLTRE